MKATSGTECGSLRLPDILSSLTDTSTLAQIVGAARKLDRTADGRTPVRFAILRNFTLEPGFPAALRIEAAKAGLKADIFLGDFDDVEQSVFNDQSELYLFAPDIVVIALRLQVVAPALVLNYAALSAEKAAELTTSAHERILSLARALRERSTATLLIHNFEQPTHPAYGILDAQMRTGQRRTIATLNNELADALQTVAGTYVVDVDRLVAELGHERAIDPRYWHLARAPFTLALQQRLAREHVAFAAALKGKSKKCIVLDCDNTLWGGVVGEDGLNGIALGQTSPGSAFLELHAAVLNLYHRGILIALASKNNEPDAMEVFTKHPNSLLKPEHFVARRINWNDKATSLREIAAQLNIGLDSLVFVDDNPFERNYVRETLPQVAVVELPKDPSRFAEIIQSLPFFDTLTLSAEDRRRTEMYRASASRDALRAQSGSLDDYLESLEMTLTIGLADSFSIPRIAQLTQKTNQFNLTTRRYAETDISSKSADPAWHVYCAEVRDKVDNLGIIAVALLHDADDVTRIDSFLMSCRVIGRGVEFAVLRSIAEDCRRRGVRTLLGEFIPTAKNELAGSFLQQCGFEASPDGQGIWSLDLTSRLPSAPRWFSEIVRREGVIA